MTTKKKVAEPVAVAEAVAEPPQAPPDVRPTQMKISSRSISMPEKQPYLPL